MPTITRPTGTCQDCGAPIVIPAKVLVTHPWFRPTICPACGEVKRQAHGGFVQVTCGGEFVIGMARLRPTAQNRRLWDDILAEHTSDASSPDAFADPEICRRFNADPRIKALRRDPTMYEPHPDGVDATRCGCCDGPISWRNGEPVHETDELTARRHRA